MAKVKDNILVFEEAEKIMEFLEDKSLSLLGYVESKTDSEFTLIRKYITHSDLPTFGKRCGREQSLEKNILYYLSVPQMEEIEDFQEREFEVAKQSNITVPSLFYEKIEMEQLQRRIGHQDENHQHKLINDYANVYLVNDSFKYFNIDYTNVVFEKLNKLVDWKKEDYLVNPDEGLFTPIELRHAIHGIGTKDDVIFHKIRRTIFKNDSLIILIEKTKDNLKNVFLLLDKNPRFFSIINETNEAWEKYQVKGKKLVEYTVRDLVEDEKTRKYQNKWRNSLAEEMMNFTTTEGGVFCPFTYIEGVFEDLGTLYRASHIKSFESCDPVEAFDVNNGLLLVANADALFDKHLITIDENKELKFSFLIEHDNILKSKLLLNQPIFKMILNEQRMRYIEEHRNIFYTKEEKRKK